VDEGDVGGTDVSDVLDLAREQVVDGDNLVVAFEKVVAQVGSDESGAAGDENAHAYSWVGKSAN
jgi:hypothetical protein